MKDIRALVEARNDISTHREVATLFDQMKPIKFTCPVCGEVYATEAEAIECRDRPYETGGLTIGTIVVVPGKWRPPGAYPEDDWMAFEIPMDPTSNDSFKRIRKRVPYYIVTAVHGDKYSARWRPHRCLVTLVTLMHGHFEAGWNPAIGVGHCALFRIDGGRHCAEGSTWLNEIGYLLDKCEPSDQMRKEAAQLARIGISTRNLL